MNGGRRMSQNEFTELARSLLTDFDDLKPWRSLPRPENLGPRDAYLLQQDVARLRERRGERLIGYKIGCASPAIQAQLGTGEPIFGRVFDSGCFPAGSTISHARFANLAIEGELAIQLARDLPAQPLADADYAAAVSSAFSVIELHNYVLPAAGGSLSALIASNGMHAGVVLAAEEATFSGRLPAVRELSVLINDRCVGRTAQVWTMDGPAATLRWLSARLAGWGAHLRRGQVILTGSVLPLYPVRPGTRVVIDAEPLPKSFATIDR
jgi:2-keto-4-pentenoate hydratase